MSASSTTARSAPVRARKIAVFLSVPAAFDFPARHDWPVWQRRCHDRALALQQRMLARTGLQAIAPASAYAQMAPIPVRCTDPEGLRRRHFEQHRIEVPVTQHGRGTFVRVSVQAYNTQAELDSLGAALAAAGV